MTDQELLELNVALKRGDLKNKIIGISLIVGLVIYVGLLFAGMDQIEKQVYRHYGVTHE